MQISHSLFVSILAVVAVTAEYDEDFCKKRIGAVDDQSAQGQKPVFHDNFYVFMEMKINLSKTTIYSDEYYSQQSQMMYATIRDKVNQTQYWIDAATDEIMSAPAGDGMCVDTPLQGSQLSQFIGATEDSTGNVELNTPEVALGWDKKFQKAIKSLGSSSARGMKTLLWNVCSYFEEQQTTTFAEWHIVDPDFVSLPTVNAKDVNKPVLPVMARIQAINKSNPANITQYSYGVDYTFFDNIQATDPIFQIPANKLCQAKPSAQVPLPTVPDYFKFKGEQITITNPNSDGQSPADFLYTVETYIHQLQLFVQDTISTPSSTIAGNDKSFVRVVNDYSTGLSFQLDRVNGQCTVSTIAGGVDSLSIAGNNVQLRTSQQFFDLDSNQYQYMGIHKMRGIDCDTWTAYFVDGQNDHLQNSMYTWYFANPQWLKANNYINYTSAMPVTLEIQQAVSYVQFNFFEFDTQDGLQTPDVSLCFDPSATMNVEMFISAAYDKIVAPSFENFGQALYISLVEKTSLNSVLRISSLDIQPASNGETVVRFKLLDLTTEKIQGDVAKVQANVPNSKIYQDLQNAINSGVFSFDVPMDSAFGGTGKVTVSAKKNSLGLFQDGKFTGSSSSSSFSSGAMAGVAFGMLLAGIVLGGLAIFGFKRFRGVGGTSDIDMKKIANESET